MAAMLSNPETRNILKAVVPITAGLASLAYIAFKLTSTSNDGFTSDKSIPTVRLRKGEPVHDIEYRENPEQFLEFCEKHYGPLFNIYLMGQKLTVVGGDPFVREVFMQKTLNAVDALDELTGIRQYFASVVKSNKEKDNMTLSHLLRDALTPKLQLFTERIVDHLDMTLGYTFGAGFDTRTVDDPQGLVYHIIAGTMAKVFMGVEIAQDPKVTESFIFCTRDFGQMLQAGMPDKSFWRVFSTNTRYGYLNNVLNPLHKHVDALVKAASPVVLERQRLEEEARAEGLPYEKPTDILQMLVDDSDKYGFVDLEDMCGHILLLVLASVHTTVDACTHMLYYFAAFPHHNEDLYQEQCELLDAQTQERERERSQLATKALIMGAQPPSFEGTSLDPKRDRELTSEVVKKMTKFDSYIREMFRYRTTRLNQTHKARKTTVFSNGQYISKGAKVIVNMRSAHYNPSLGEDMHEFKPFRYVNQVGKSPVKPATDMLFFGLGTHACPGRFLAVQEMKIFGSLFLQRYSRVEFKDPVLGMSRMTQIVGDPLDCALILTGRHDQAAIEAISVPSSHVTAATTANSTTTTTTTTTTATATARTSSSSSSSSSSSALAVSNATNRTSMESATTAVAV
ncbi:hypothetical protein BG004_002804 [Podila humilis]|nr:hypothetical protein BG004_002804 [Podila humilis]